MQDGGVIPASGFPRDGGMETSDNSDMVQTYRTSHTCKGISSRSSRVIPSKRAFRGGSKLSREVLVHVATVVEVVVLAMVVKVVVLAMVVVRGLGGSSCSRTCSSWYTVRRSSGGGSGTRFDVL